MIKLLPYPLVYVKEIENWLNQMSLDGYHLVKLNSIFATFKKGEPRDFKYNIIIHYNTSPSEKNSKLDIYDDFDWELIDYNIGIPKLNRNETKIGFAVYKSPNPSENIRLDVLDDHILKKKSSQYSTSGYTVVLIVVLVLQSFDILFSLFFEDSYFILLRMPITFFILALLAIILDIFNRKRYKIHKQIHKYYNKEIDRLKIPSKKKYKAIVLIRIVILVLFLTRFSISLITGYTSKLPAENIQNVLDASAITGYEELKENIYNGSRDYSIIAPQNYTLNEFTYLENEHGKSIMYTINYTKTWIKGLPKLFYLTYNKKNYAHTSSKHFNNIAYFEEEKSQYYNVYMIMQNDYELIYIESDSWLDALTIVENIENHYNEVQDD